MLVAAILSAAIGSGGCFEVEAILDAYPDWRIPARVEAIIPTADRARATIRVRVALGERDARILPDMAARVTFLDDN